MNHNLPLNLWICDPKLLLFFYLMLYFDKIWWHQWISTLSSIMKFHLLPPWIQLFRPWIKFLRLWIRLLCPWIRGPRAQNLNIKHVKLNWLISKSDIIIFYSLYTFFRLFKTINMYLIYACSIKIFYFDVYVLFTILGWNSFLRHWVDIYLLASTPNSIKVINELSDC